MSSPDTPMTSSQVYIMTGPPHVWQQGSLIETVLEVDGTTPKEYKVRLLSSTSYNGGDGNNASSILRDNDNQELNVIISHNAVKSYPNSQLPFVNLIDITSTTTTSASTSSSITASSTSSSLLSSSSLKIYPNMTNLPNLHEPAILFNLKARHETSLPYTLCGEIIIAVNPYKWLGETVYSDVVRKTYSNRYVYDKSSSSSSSSSVDGESDELPPHIYIPSSQAYNSLLTTPYNQSILVSGESGAGKTETVKLLMGHLSFISSDQYNCSPPESPLPLSSSSTSPISKSAAEKSAAINPVVKRVLDSNPLLEAFGNAKTIRNDNSSRFGKYTQLQFLIPDQTSQINNRIFSNNGDSGSVLPAGVDLVGSVCNTYLLEKNRVVSHEKNERSYHIFYQMLSQSVQDKVGNVWEGYSQDCYTGEKGEGFKCLMGGTETSVIEGVTDSDRYVDTVDALHTIGITDVQIRELMRALTIVLVLSNLVFTGLDGEDMVDEGAGSGASNAGYSQSQTQESEGSLISPASSQTLTDLSTLLGVPENVLIKNFTHRTVVARGEAYSVPLSPSAAKDGVDAFAKELYSKVFDWLVCRINEATAHQQKAEAEASKAGENLPAPPSLNSPRKSSNTPKKISTVPVKLPPKSQIAIIGLLDIFGFECFQTNRFEQLCINYCNEKLQQKFTSDVFQSVVLEYKAEGLPLADVVWVDNIEVLSLIEGKMGIVNLLNEECVRPKGNDVAFVSKITTSTASSTTSAGSSDVLITSKKFHKTQFGINHYAGTVIYDASRFVKKNTDTLPADLVEIGILSTNTLIRSEMARAGEEASRGGKRGSLVSMTVLTKFKVSLDSLMTSLKVTRTRYIRCIKPNKLKEPLLMDHESTVEQLRCAGVVAAVTISRAAFPNRLEHNAVYERFGSLAQSRVAQDCTIKELLAVILEASDGFAVGKTRVYFRSGTLEKLEQFRVLSLGLMATKISKTIRGFFAYTTYTELRAAIVIIQGFYRGTSKRKGFVRMRASAVVIQCARRCFVAKRQLIFIRRERQATRLQSMWRMRAVRTEFLLYTRSVVRVQSWIRSIIQKRKYVIRLAEVIEERKIGNQLIALQKRLEDAEERGRKAEETAKRLASLPKDERNETSADGEGFTSVASADSNTLMNDSSKMIDYMRIENFNLRKQNKELALTTERVKEDNRRLMDVNAAAGASFAALNQHAKQLSKINIKFQESKSKDKTVLNKLTLQINELKEELKVQKATYVGEVNARVKFAECVDNVSRVVAEKSEDVKLVEQVRAIARDCTNQYLEGGMAVMNGNNGDANGLKTPGKGKRSGGGRRTLFGRSPSGNDDTNGDGGELQDSVMNDPFGFVRKSFRGLLPSWAEEKAKDNSATNANANATTTKRLVPIDGSREADAEDDYSGWSNTTG